MNGNLNRGYSQNMIGSINYPTNFQQTYYPYSQDSTSSTKSSDNNYYRSKTTNIISFNIKLTTGQTFPFNDDENHIFKLTFNKFLQQYNIESLGTKLNYAICKANKVDFNKSLKENNIQNNDIVLLIGKGENDNMNMNYDGFLFFGHISKPGQDKNGNPKINQDRTIIYTSVGNIRGFNIFGVLDGHGHHGHLLAQFCQEYFIRKMADFANICLSERIINPDGIYNKLKMTKFKYIFDIFKNVEYEMTKQNQFEFNYSGTTCNLVIQLNKNLISANVGNSRGIIIENNNFNSIGFIPVVQISNDHTPDIPQEYQRIINKGGRVDKYMDEYGNRSGHNRIYKKDQKVPGIRVSRALGNFEAKKCGVISQPEIIEYKINFNTKYMVICSDGIWEFLTNEAVRNLGNFFYQTGDVGNFCSKLVKEACIGWGKFDIYRDDITVLCVFF